MNTREIAWKANFNLDSAEKGGSEKISENGQIRKIITM